MNRPVVPVCMRPPGGHCRRSRGGRVELDPIPVAHTVDVPASRNDYRKVRLAIQLGESDAKDTVIVAGLGAALAATASPWTARA